MGVTSSTQRSPPRLHLPRELPSTAIWGAILQPELPSCVSKQGHTFVDESQGQLRGQLAHRKLLGLIEDRLRAWAAFRNSGASKAGHRGLDGLLQLPQIAVELGLSQSLRRRHKLQRAVAMLVVVPVREAVHPVPGLLQRVEGPLRPQRALLRRSERMP